MRITASNSRLKESLRGAVKWHTGWVISVLIAVGVATFQMRYFSATYIVIAAGTFYSVGAWIFSETLAKKRPAQALLYLPDGTQLTNRHKYATWLWTPVVLLVVTAGFLTMMTRTAQVDAQFQSLEGRLYPAGEDAKPPCPLKHPDDLELAVGNSAYIARQFPHTVIAINCDDILQFERASDNSVALNLKVFGDDGKILVELDHGYFRVNRNNFFKIDRHHSLSTLSVYDQHDREVLYLHLANRNVLQMRALIYDPRLTSPLRLDENNMMGLPNTRSDHVCVDHSGRGVDVEIGRCLVR